MEGFTLRKSYLDVVDGHGRCAIAYWADLSWGPLALRWQALTIHEPGRPAVHRGAFGDAGRPLPLTWRSAALGFRANGEPWCAPFASRLLETPFGFVEWSCDAPGADVALECDDGTSVRGAGYSEHLVLAMRPWKLPIDELRWGRWLSLASRQSIVWIDWKGPKPLALVLAGGVAQAGAVVDHEQVRWGERTLGLTAGETLYSRTLAQTLKGAGPWVSRLPASWQALEDRKTVSRGMLDGQDGWAIHELVRFP